MTVNPKKLRPYDEPPRKRRVWIPERPDSAATGFLVVAALWFGLAGALGLAAIGLQLFSALEFSVPLPFGIEATFDARRVDQAFVNAVVYGWLSNAAFGAVAFIVPRLVGRPMRPEKGLNLALAIWNLSVAGGLAALYVIEAGPAQALTAFPFWAEGGMAFALLIVTASFVLTAAAGLRHAYVSTWFMAVALLAFLGLLGAEATIGLLTALGLVDLPDLLLALASLYDTRAVELFWVLGMAYAVLYYVVPRATDQPLASRHLAILAWVTWLVLAGLAPLARVVDTSVPYAITSGGIVTTLLLMVPALLTVTVLVQTFGRRWHHILRAGTAAFAAVALAFLLATAVLDGIGALRSVSRVLGNTDWMNGAFAFGMLGTGTFAMLVLIEHAMPRLLRRAWGGGTLAAAQLWLTFGGVTILGLALMASGLAEGAMLSQGASPADVLATLVWYRGIAWFGMSLVALAGLSLLINLFLLYTTGEPVRLAGTAASTGGH